MTSPNNPTPARNVKWVTHLALSADVILGDADSANCVHDVRGTMDDSEGQIHNIRLNCWSRDVPEQGVYIFANVPFATNPHKLGVADPATMRLVPAELDGEYSATMIGELQTDRDVHPGSEDGANGLPAAPILLTGVAVVDAVAADRKSALFKGFTYLNKTDQYQQFCFRGAFPDTPKYASWFVVGGRNLVNFDCTVTREGGHHILETSLIRVTLLGPAPQPLLQALKITTPGTDDRAKRIRDAREAARAAQAEKPKDVVDTPTTPKNTVVLITPADPKALIPSATIARPVSPTPTRLGKRGRVD
ncbi:hypothetical protein CF336_g7265 [Tilletia laevis]|nr:hypothetical protein CF336_g7265 [Tilletia laevis]